MKPPKKLLNILKKADIQKVSDYIVMFDRILLYSLAVHILPEEVIKGTVDMWSTSVKRAIDYDANQRTTYLEGSVPGRAAKLRKEPDGEDLRLHCLKQHEIARTVIETNLKTRDDTDADEISY